MAITTTPSGGPQGEFSTYTPIYSQTLSATTSSVTFSNIPTTYTDLVLVIQGTWAGTGYEAISFTFNGDTGSNYSRTLLNGTGTSALSSRESTSNWGALGNDQSNSIIHIMNYSNATTYKTILSRGNSATNQVRATVGLWRSTSPITSITTQMASNSIASGTTFTLYGIKAAPAALKANGGDITSDGTYTYHTFKSTSSFVPNQALTCDYLVIAGGGAGGNNKGGGGGAGGLVYVTSQSLTSGTVYPVTVGAGGTAGNSGTNSVFRSTTSIGGGFGGTYTGTNTARKNGGNGGSGGGGSSGDYNPAGSGGTGTSGQGNAGGSGTYSISGVNTNDAGGGGGFSAAGGNGTSGQAGAGGAGTNTYSSWAYATGTGYGGYYCGGGGGGSWGNAPGAGGAGGGGAGDTGSSPSNAVVNTGSGGGGTGQAGYPGGSGSSGLVIVRYTV